jgi:hypothetical protein
MPVSRSTAAMEAVKGSGKVRWFMKKIGQDGSWELFLS